jgi:mono/diheme cytochrome c family protein
MSRAALSFEFVARGLALALAVLAMSACGPAAPAASSTPADAAQIERGRYLVKAADCAACHTAPGGAPFAGGVSITSDFGTFYGTNITPDRKYGIGAWSAAAFYKTLHDGVTPARQLYPAMPYTSYRSMSRADSDAIYAYLMAQKPVALESRSAELRFPFNLRAGMFVWNFLFRDTALPDASKGASADWTRGRYLAGALGHCAECHTPRGIFGQLDTSRTLQGAALGRVAAVDITPEGLAARGWTSADLQTFFATGVAPQGSAFGEMHPVVMLSTQYLSHDDQRALATYLLGDTPPTPKSLPAVSADTAQLGAGRNLYLGVCAGCHGRAGEGKPHVAVSMRGNSTVRDASVRNLLVAMLDGVEEQRFTGHESMQPMPAFATRLSDAEIAQLANYLRATWGGQAANVSAADVGSLR